MPFRYQEMPPEFNGLPITDLDVYYEDKKTFMVISGGKVRNLYLMFPRMCSIHEIWIDDTDTRYRLCI